MSRAAAGKIAVNFCCMKFITMSFTTVQCFFRDFRAGAWADQPVSSEHFYICERVIPPGMAKTSGHL